MPGIVWSGFLPSLLYYTALVMHLICTGTYLYARKSELMYPGVSYQDLTKDQKEDVSSAAELYYGNLLAAWNILCLASTGWLGTLSDRVGRKPVLLLCTVCSAIGSIGTLIVCELNLPLWVLFPVMIVAGAGGTIGAFNAALFAHTADRSDAQHRGASFAVLESSIFLGSTVAPLIGSKLQDVSSGAPFIAAFVTFMLTLVAITFGMAETVPDASVSRFRETSWWEAQAQTFVLVRQDWCHRQESKVPVQGNSIVLLAGCFALLYFCSQCSSSIMTMYLKLDPFEATTDEIGYEK